jgi:hypothetical protein
MNKNTMMGITHREKAQHMMLSKDINLALDKNEIGAPRASGFIKTVN